MELALRVAQKLHPYATAIETLSTPSYWPNKTKSPHLTSLALLRRLIGHTSRLLELGLQLTKIYNYAKYTPARARRSKANEIALVELCLTLQRCVIGLRARRPPSYYMWLRHCPSAILMADKASFYGCRFISQQCRLVSSPIGFGSTEQEILTITGQSSKLSSTNMNALLLTYPPTNPRLSAHRLVLRLTEMARSGDGDLDD
ncbi:hypothetical protein YC2023_011068 [Brassica napus]